MPKYALLFKIDKDTVRNEIAHPEDRESMIGKLAAEMGGSLDAYYWMFGQYDGMAVFDLPDSVTMAGMALAVAGSGALSSVETHELMTSSDISRAMEKARAVQQAYPH